VQQSTRDVARQLGNVVVVLQNQKQSPTITASLEQVQQSLQRDIKRLSAAPSGNRPVTLGISEPFTTTVTVTLIFALILSLPILLLQAYGFLMPAFEPRQRRRMLPVTYSIPVLFAAGVAFGYFVVLPAALHFFQNFNSSEFNVLVQASQYYKFAATMLLAMGLLFQVPVAIFAITRAAMGAHTMQDSSMRKRGGRGPATPPGRPALSHFVPRPCEGVRHEVSPPTGRACGACPLRGWMRGLLEVLGRLVAEWLVEGRRGEPACLLRRLLGHEHGRGGLVREGVGQELQAREDPR